MLKVWILGIPYVAQLGYLFVLVGAFLETLPGIGVFIPGQTILVIAGFLAHEGILHLDLVFIAAASGAILGDWLGFTLGRRYGIAYFFAQKGFIQETASLLRAHPMKTIIFGRFNSLTRSFAPFAAGASGIRARIFYVANVIGGMLWATVWMFIGFIFAESYDRVAVNIEKILFFAILAGLLAFIAYRFLRKRKLLRPQLTRYLFASLCSLALFVFLYLQIKQDGFMVMIDHAVSKLVPAVWTPVVIFFAKAASMLVHPIATALLSGIVIGLLWLRHNKRHAVLFVLLMAGAAVLDLIVKATVLRSRPQDALVLVQSPSFPSGHVVLSTVFCLGVYFLYRQYIARKALFAALLAVAPVIIAFSRLYLSVHYLSDVLAGFALGIGWVCFVLLLAEAHESYLKARREKLYHS